MSDLLNLLDYNEELDSDNEKDSRENLLKSRRFVSNDETEDNESRRSRSPIRTPSFDSRESTESRESTLEPIEEAIAPKTRYTESWPSLCL